MLCLMMLVPFMSYGENKKLTLAHADKTTTRPAVPKNDSKKKLKDDVVYYGNVKFQVGSTVITCDSAVVSENDNTMTAYSQVKISNPESFNLKGDALKYNKDSHKGTISSNVLVTAKNNAVVGTSETIDVDFSEDAYRINGGAITAPQPEKEK